MNLLQKLQGRVTVLQEYSNYYRDLHHMELKGKVGSRMKFKGKEHIIWCLNDYLGFMNHPESIKAATKVTSKYGPSYPHSVRLSIGNTALHEELEEELKEMMQMEDAMLVNLGYQAFTSIIDALTDRHDTIIYDQNAHACLIDGVRLHNGRKFAFKHNSISHLEMQLKRAYKSHNPNQGIIMVIVDGLYSMTGEFAPLKEIARLKEKYDFTLFVDDSHAFGVFGENGRGSAERAGVEKEVDIYVSTFTKAFGSLGGFVAAKEEIITYLRYAVRSQIFSRTLPLPMVATVLKTMEIFKREPHRRKVLMEKTKLFQNGLKRLGIYIGNTQSPITPVHINGSIKTGVAILRELRNQRIFSYLVAYPVVAKDTCLIRMVSTFNHTEQDIEETLKGFKAVKEKFPTELASLSRVRV
jgi:glycine C-acetyltransferase